MRKRIAAGLMVLAAGIVGLSDVAVGQQPKDKTQPKVNPTPRLYGHDLPVRSAGTSEVTAKTIRYGVDVFKDDTTGAVIAISQAGSIAVTPFEALGAEKGRSWVAAYDLAVRKVGEPEFTQKTKKWGVELFKFPASDQLIYASESGAIAFAKIPLALGMNKGWKRSHGLDMKVREPGASEFTNAKKFGVEAYLDQNTNGLLYISEAGSLAAIPGAVLGEGKKIAPPTALYGLELKVRKADELEFSPKTKPMAVEVFEDPNTNVMLYISENGYVAAAPVKKLAATGGVELVKGLNLKARKSGEDDEEKAAKFGVEVFRDNRTGYLIFISETGAISVLVPKQ
jgi:hypothetical protein